MRKRQLLREASGAREKFDFQPRSGTKTWSSGLKSCQLIKLTVVNATVGKVLVSGSSGLIGSALIPALIAGGYRVVRLVRGTPSTDDEITWDPTKPLAPESVSGFDAVVHLAGESIVGRWTEDKKRRIVDSRVLSTRHLSEAIVKTVRPPQVLVCASAIGYYGDRGDEVLREDCAPGRNFSSQLCLQWEAAAQPAATARIRTVNSRFGIVLSTAGGALKQMLPPFRLGIGGKIGSGRQWMSWIDLKDVVGAILHILKTDSLRGPVNVVAPNPVTNALFTKILAAVLSRPAIFPMPALAARLAFGQMADELLLASQRVEPAKLLASGFVFQRPELRPSLQAMLRN